MSITELRIENFKRVRALTINPDGSPMVVLAGRNMQGKSSTLDAIKAILGGARCDPEQPIRSGARKGMVFLKTDKIIGELVYTKSGRRLKLNTLDGQPLSSGQSVLNEMYNALSFDPLEFARAKPEKQAATLRKLAGLDLSELDARRKDLFDERTLKNREVRNLEGTLDGMEKPTGADEKPEDIDKLMDELDRARGSQRKAEMKQEAAASLKAELMNIRDQMSALKKRAEDASKELADATTAAEKARMRVKDPAPIQERIRRSQEIAATAGERARYSIALEQLAEAKKEADHLTDSINSIDEEKARKLEEATFPVDGLLVDDDCVTYNSIPLSQASQAECLRVSVAVGMALNPDLKVMLVRDASLLDKDGMAELQRIAEEHGGQVWVERVGDGDEGAIIIEDGLVLRANEVAPETEADCAADDQPELF
jgi:chromosome segregation ATPase